MGKKFRLTALTLAVSLLLNMVPLPVNAEEDSANTGAEAAEEALVAQLSDDEQLVGSSGDTILEGDDATSKDNLDTDNADTDNADTDNADTDNADTDNADTDNADTDNADTDNADIDNADTDNADTDDAPISDDVESVDDEILQGDVALLTEGEDVVPLSAPNPGEGTLEWWAQATGEGYTAGNTELRIARGWDLICLSYVNPEFYQRMTLNIVPASSQGNELDTTTVPIDALYSDLTFQGLGRAGSPFAGTVMYTQGTDAVIKLNRPLFQALQLDDAHSLAKLYLKSKDNKTALLAEKVSGTSSHQITVHMKYPEADEGQTPVLPPVIETIAENADITISVINEVETDSDGQPKQLVNVTGNGLICNTLEGNAHLTVNEIRNYPGLNAANGNAGGLVGTMNTNASLTVSSNISVSNISGKDNVGGLVGQMKSGASVIVNAKVSVSNISGSNAGGLVGKMESGAKLDASNGSLILKDTGDTKAVTGSSNAGGCVGFATDIVFSIPTITVDSSAAVYGTGSAGVGGLIGAYTYTGTSDVFNSVTGITIPRLTLACAGNGGKSGALFGKLSNNSGSTFSISTVTVTDVVFQNGSAGGLIGQYGTTGLSAALEISNATVSTSLTSNARDYGGLIGVDDCGNPAYIKISGAEVTMNSSRTPEDFGGLVSRLQNKDDNTDVGHLLNLEGNVTVTVDGNFMAGYSTGGLVAYLQNGVIRIGGNVTINGTLAATDKARGGWVVGDLGNALVYVDQSVEGAGLTLTDTASNPNQYNDLGRWGQVLKANDDKLPELLIFSEAEHKVTVAAATLGSCTTHTDATCYSVSSLLEFATVALRLQLNPVGALVFGGGDISGPVDITIGQDITLSNGLFGLQRDHKDSDQFAVTIHGGGNTITLPNTPDTPNTTVYPTGDSHNRLGLLSNVSALTAENLTVAGGINFDQSSGSIYAGGLAAYAAGDVTLTNVTGAANITGSGTMGSDELSGLIAHVEGNKTLTFTGCSWTSTIEDSGTSTDVYIGGFLGKGTNVGMSVSSGTLGSSTLSSTIRKNNATTAKAGGLVASLSGGTLNIDGLTISNASIEATSATGTCGGLLSYELLDTKTNIAGVTIANSSVNAGGAGFGGLVYKASGVMTIEKNTDNVGVSIGTGNSFAGGSSKSGPSGLLVCRGDQQDANDKALYLKVLDGAYSVNSGTMVTLSGDTDYFDELVGITKGAYGNGVVSIATPSGFVDYDRDPKDGGSLERNTYVQQITNSDGKIWDNPRTRYYYNLDSIAPANGAIDSAEELVMWSVAQYCHNSLETYFLNGTSTVITGDIDLRGYSYYPVSCGGMTINNATITFDYDNLQTVEGTENKEPGNGARQHYLMHTGLFTDVTGGLTVNGLTLKGVVGPSSATGSGALINGTAYGTQQNPITLNINTVALEGIQVSGVGATTTYAPLLINKIGSYVTMNMDGVTTKNYTTPTTAGTSLIGKVGSVEGTEIKLVFSNMALDAKMGNVEYQEYYGSCGTIFSHATFLESFMYGDKTTCSGEYNFAMKDKYTVGVEISNTDSGRNPQNQYRDQGGVYVKYPTDENSPATDGEAKSWFSSGYKRYVSVAQDENQKSYELDINQKPQPLSKGCGTYGDPYIIEYASQLEAVAKIIQGRKIVDWPVRVNEAAKKDPSAQDGHGPNPATGDCNYTQQPDGSWKHENDTLSEEDVQNYLCNAYYKISENLEFSSTWGGLGTKDKPFKGVIIGTKNANENYKITINSTTAQQYGGLIKFSKGSVVKNLKIEFSGSATVLDAGVPSSLSDAAFFGGVVGWCHGGDTIIDDVSVTGLSGVSLSGNNNQYLSAVGGYVGLVGGFDSSTGGGVVFKGTIGDSTLGKEGTSDFYKNPYVGRVLDGYAVYDAKSGKLENTDKNYTIPTISGTGHLSWASDTSTVTVNDAQGLWLLSAIVNSGADNVSKDGAYNNGKVRTCKYDQIRTQIGEDSTELSDEKGNSNSYLVHTFIDADYQEYFSALTSKSPVNIVLNAACDMTSYGNGFRGIGTSYGDQRLLNVGSLNGKNQKVILNQNRQEYTAESGNWVSRGAGLFTQLHASSEVTVSNLNLCGQTGITYNNDGTEDTSMNVKSGNIYPAVGMLVGRSTGTGAVTLTNVCIAQTTVDTETKNPQVVGTAHSAGGLIGWIENSGQVTMTNCTYEHLTVQGRLNTGGLLGYLQVSKAAITCNKDITLKNGTITSRAGQPTDNSGAGGLVGKCYQTVLTIGSETSRLTLNKLSVNYSAADNAAGDRPNCGGLVGLWGAKKDNNVSFDAVIQNVSLEGAVTITGGKMANAGGLVGGLTNEIWGNWNNGGGIRPKITDVDIAQAEGSSMRVTRARQMGGLIGVMVVSGAMEVSHVRMGTSDNQVVVANNGEGGTLTVGGLFGVTLFPNMAMEDVRIENTKVLLHTAGGMRGAALLFAFLQKSPGTIDLRHVVMKDCAVVADGHNTNMGLLYAKMENNHTITGSNILVQDCSVGLALDVDASDSTKFNLHKFYVKSGNVETYNQVYGKVGLKFSGKGYKSYEAMDDTAFKAWPATDNCANICVWGGQGDSNSQQFVKLVGVTLKQTKNALPHTKDFGSDMKSGSYLIRSNYLGKDVISTDETTGAVTVHATDKPETDNAALPLVDGTVDQKLTSDGVYSDTNVSVASQILTDYSGKNLKRVGLNADVAAALNKFNPTGGAYKDCLSTFAKTGKASVSTFDEANDFPVLLITAKDAKTINAVVDSYISLLTNYPVSHADNGFGLVNTNDSLPYTITATTYVWKDSRFEKAENGKQTLIPNGNALKSNGGLWDYQKDQFTLLDVQFQDPAYTKDIAYHLYIPVVIQKVFEYRFWASAKVGTTYQATTYNELRNLAIGSHNEPVTALIGFDYLRTKEEWQSAVNSGENLLWNLKKEVILQSYQEGIISLPKGTELILVDRGNMADDSQVGKAYYATVNYDTLGWSGRDNRLDFTKFTDSEGKLFQRRPLCDELKLEVKEASDGLFVTTGPDVSRATLRASLGGKIEYFRLATDTDENPKYSITVNVDEGGAPVSEQYYLTIRTPKVSGDSNPIHNFNIQCADKLDVNGGIPTKRMDYALGSPFTRNSDENHIVLSNFFTQTVTVTTEPSDTNPVEAKVVEDYSDISARSNIVATVTTSIQFTNQSYIDTFKGYAGNQRLFQCFDINLTEFTESGTNNKPFAPNTQILVEYRKGDTMIRGEPISLSAARTSVQLPCPFTDSDGMKGFKIDYLDLTEGLTLKAEIYLAYDAAGILEQFPTRPIDTATYGIMVGASSSLSYTEDTLQGSYLRATGSDANNHHYYRSIDSAATLSYTARNNAAAAPGEGISHLGINGLENNFPVQSLAVYNVEKVENASAAKKMKCTVTLWCKGENGEYAQVKTDDIHTYLSSLTIALTATDSSNNRVQCSSVQVDKSGTATFELPQTDGYFDSGSFLEIPVDMTVVTGEAFEKAGYRYANYQVRLTAELLDQTEKQIKGSAASDFIVYTNAKIVKELINQREASTQ